MEAKEDIRKIGFSFCRYFNKQKKLGYPTLFEYALPTESALKWTTFQKWIEQHGVVHDKIAYPAIFTARPGITYMGMLAIEDIGPHEVIVRVPSSIIITTKIAYFSELNPVFKENPKVFAEGSNPRYWEDYMMISFILYEKQKGEKSFWHPYISIFPEHCDCLLNWDDEEIDEVQDKILIADAQKEFNEISHCWAELYNCLRKYPKHFSEESISFNQFKWAYILIYTRLFGNSFHEIKIE